MKTYQRSLFDETKQMEKLSRIGDPLERLNAVMKWEMFRPILKRNVERKEPTEKGGRPPYDMILMFKILILQRLYNISDEQAEYQINDRLSFKRFLGLSVGEPVPDAKTIWKFRNDLSQAEEGIEELFLLFDRYLENEGLITHKGTIIDATFVDVPRQRNNRKENEAIKCGEIPEEWSAPEAAKKLAQKDTDARWAKKNDETHYGYKNHVKCDAESKLITSYGVTDASVHDSQMCLVLLEETDQVLYADSGYAGAPIRDGLPEGCVGEICEKGTKGHPLTEKQKTENKRKSRTRCRIEHIFGFMANSLGGITIRSIGFERAWVNIGLMNLTYNFSRYAYLKRPKPSEG